MNMLEEANWTTPAIDWDRSAMDIHPSTQAMHGARGLCRKVVLSTKPAVMADHGHPTGYVLLRVSKLVHGYSLRSSALRLLVTMSIVD